MLTLNNHGLLSSKQLIEVLKMKRSDAHKAEDTKKMAYNSQFPLFHRGAVEVKARSGRATKLSAITGQMLGRKAEQNPQMTLRTCRKV